MHRYSYSEAQLAELITHAAVDAQHGGGSSARPGTGAAAVAVGVSNAPSERKRRRLLDAEHASFAARGEAEAVSSSRGAAGGWSPLETVEERSRRDPDWAAWHYRQAWFLQVRCGY